MNGYNFNHLYYFYITAKLEGITLAAKHLNTSQSSLSVQIKNLEHSVGSQLFRKIGRNIVLTESGKELFQFCRRAFETFEEMHDYLQKSKSAMGIRINIGVSNDIDRPFVTEIIAKSIRQYQKSKQPLVRLISQDSESLINLLKTGQLDFLISTGAIIDGAIRINSNHPLPVFAYCSKEVFIDLKKGNFLDALKSKHFGSVLPSKPTLLRAETEAYFIKKKIWPVITFESNILASVVRASVDSLGLTFLPKAYVGREIKSEKLYPVNEIPLWNHRIHTITSTGRANDAKKEFLDKITAEIDNLFLNDKRKLK